jgi:hypothetical protein
VQVIGLNQNFRAIQCNPPVFQRFLSFPHPAYPLLLRPIYQPCALCGELPEALQKEPLVQD